MSEHLYYIRRNEEELGPLTLSQLRSMWGNGAIGVKTPYREEGGEQWGTLGAMQSILEGAMQPPPVPQMPPSLPDKLQPAPDNEYVPPGGKGGLGCLAVGVIGVVGLFIFSASDEKPTGNVSPQPRPAVQRSSEPSFQPVVAPPVVAPPSNITWREIDLFYFKGKNTDLQKAAKWKEYEGQRIEWSGKVSSISEGFFGGVSMQVKMNPDTLVSDLIITLNESEASKAINYKEGSPIKFKATLKNWGNFLGISLTDGEIIEK